MAELKIITPVGTSFVTNITTKDRVEYSLSGNSNDDRILDNHIKTLKQNKDYQPLRHFFVEGNSRKDKDINPAEASSLYAFWHRQKKELSPTNNKDKVEVDVLLLHSPDPIGTFCAKGIAKLLKDGGYMDTDHFQWQPRREELAGLNVHDAKKFHNALEDLADIVAREIEGFEGEVYINITGGYKALGPYLTMMGMALGRRVTVFYLFEESLEVIFLPRYPMAFDMLQWRDWRSLLFPFTMEGLISPAQQKQLFNGLVDTKVQGLLREQDGKGYGLNSIGRIMHGFYDERDAKAAITEFGQGHLLLGMFSDNPPGPQMKSYLIERCFPLWRHLAVGDHIPETVEHGRGHVQRLLELAQQLFEARVSSAQDAEKLFELSPDQAFVLICSIWLHDIGHTGNYFTFEGKEGLIQNSDTPASTERFYVYGDPDKVRKYHNFLSYGLITDTCDFLFPEKGRPAGADMEKLIRSIALACLFHRNRMPVADSDPRAIKGTQCRVAHCIEEYADDARVIKDFPLVAALLRFLDGAENQQERSGSDSCLEVTKWVIERQVRSIAESPAFSHDPWLQRMHEFKKIQPDHFDKHSMVRHVFLVYEEENGLAPEGISGKAGKPLIGVYLVANNKKEGYDEQKVINEIVRDLKNEYDSVESLLPFRIVLVLVEKKEGTTIKKQVVFHQSPPYSLHHFNR